MKVLITVISVVVIVIGIVFVMVIHPHTSQAPTSQTNQQTTSLPSAASSQSGSSNSSGNTSIAVASSTPAGGLTIATQNGSMSVRNFLSDPTTIADPYNKGYYQLNSSASTSLASSSQLYSITYIASTQYFNIALLREPIGTARADAEQFLLSELGITKEQACSLNYMLSVPYWVNQNFTGRNLGFSFCPGAVTLPQ